MMQAAGPKQVSPAVLVITPVTVLTLIFAAVLTALLVRASGDTHPILVTGVVAYAVAIVVLVRFGLSNIGKLEILGLTDSLAAMPNRRALHLDCERTPPGAEKALALLDLDGFKSVNDQYGHFAGDRLIKQCAGLLAEVCGSEARAYRLGGDEFAILVIGPIAGNILKALSHICWARCRMRSPSRAHGHIGAIAACRSGGRDARRLRSCCGGHLAMYAPGGVKNRCTLFNAEFRQESHETRSRGGALDALKRGNSALPTIRW